MDAILVERDYKGEYERFALTPEEFKEEYPDVFKKCGPIEGINSVTLSPMIHITFERCTVGGEVWNNFFTNMKMGLPESDIESGNLAYIRQDLFQSLKEYLPENAKDNNYPHLSLATDFEYLKDNLSETALDELERIIDAYSKDKIDIEIVRDENDEIKFEESFSLIVNDKDYKKYGFESLALKWYEGFEDTGFFVECFSEIESNSYQFTVDYSENGAQKSFQIGIAAKEKPDSMWLAQKISNYFSAHYKGSVEKAINSVEGIDVHITDYRGEYVDSDEIYGDDLKALFEHLKKDKPGLDSVISSAKQRQENISDNNFSGFEPER